MIVVVPTAYTVLPSLLLTQPIMPLTSGTKQPKSCQPTTQPLAISTALP